MQFARWITGAEQVSRADKDTFCIWSVSLSGGMYTLSGILVLLTLWGLKVGKQAAQKTETTVGDKQAVGIQVSE